MWDKAKQHSLSPTQLQVLLRLASDPPGRRRIGVLADELDVSHPTVSDAVAVLRRKGLVHRDPGSRKAGLSLSARGQAVTAELTDWDQRTRQQLADLPVGDKQARLRLLLDLIAGLQSCAAITVARMCVTCRFFRPNVHDDPGRPHHCAFVDAPFGDRHLRLECLDQEPAPPEQARLAWQSFVGAGDHAP